MNGEVGGVTETSLSTMDYENQEGQVTWRGASMTAGENSTHLYRTMWLSRLNDEEGQTSSKRIYVAWPIPGLHAKA